MLCRVFVFSLVAANLIEAYIQLDYSEQGEQLHTCEIDGLVDQNIHQLHGNLVNCQSPPMECSIDPHEYLIKSRTNVECRVPSDDLFFYDDKACSFRFYYRRSYCFYNSRCYSLTMSCHPVATPTPLLLGIILTIIVVTVALILCFVYCIYLWCWKTSELSIPKQDKKLEKVRRESQKKKLEESVRYQHEHTPMKLETSI
ncbi:uncharacterized protein CELE_F56C4.2 [Caenorhabditis elegans]|uniref:Uncharacterized protein n=1 Tax=Caenorhabditis elegans TaxID=6239 RepID=Q20860_CAEEL|nr:Uncharacterized protein CELE_F56C4.2 [Caenorhabditis elegans]CAA94289.3 Uncharacterized protein CELE_F56C4.2 [Caenorhabditis elegans]|eukprot:NP_501966.3 Uncharacterized protein CELE_F56C4.2 [Caenorhabditis elegans]